MEFFYFWLKSKLMLRKIRFLRYWIPRLVLNRKYRSFGLYSKVISPLKIMGSRNIEVGNNVTVNHNAWLVAMPLVNNGECRLVIGDGTCIGHLNHIFATQSIVIGKKVLTADKVYIADNMHSYESVQEAIMDQPIKQLAEVSIGDGSWLGENVCIIGASVGQGCVIGANSVVNRNIPDYCVAVGSPAKVIKRYCFGTNKWRLTNKLGEFI